MNSSVQPYVFGQNSYYINPFVIEIDTRNVLAGGTDANSFFLPQSKYISDSFYDFLIDWDDGSFSFIKSIAEAETPHVYAVPGIYRPKFYRRKGNFELRPNFSYKPLERLKILKIYSWGSFNNSQGCFINCTNLDLSQVQGGFKGSGVFESDFRNIGTIKFPNTDKIVMNSLNNAYDYMFYLSLNLNDDITLNMPSATACQNTFNGCINFAGNVVINAPNLQFIGGFFRNCKKFNRPVHNIGFDFTKITSMSNFMTGKTSADYNADYYDLLLMALDAAGRSNVVLGMGSIKYTSAGATARANLIAKGWNITDGGLL